MSTLKTNSFLLTVLLSLLVVLFLSFPHLTIPLYRMHVFDSGRPTFPELKVWQTLFRSHFSLCPPPFNPLLSVRLSLTRFTPFLSYHIRFFSIRLVLSVSHRFLIYSVLVLFLLHYSLSSITQPLPCHLGNKNRRFLEKPEETHCLETKQKSFGYERIRIGCTKVHN